MNYRKGFTFLELLISLVLIGILSAMAYPSYLDYLVRSRRADGLTALLELATQMEQYYALHNTYKTATIGQDNSSDIRTRTTSAEGWYNLSIRQQTETDYTLQAQAISQQAKNDPKCATLLFTSVGEKLPNSRTSHCWI